MSLTFHFSLSLASFLGSYCTNRLSHICVWMLQYAESTSSGQLLSASLGEHPWVAVGPNRNSLRGRSKVPQQFTPECAFGQLMWLTVAPKLLWADGSIQEKWAAFFPADLVWQRDEGSTFIEKNVLTMLCASYRNKRAQAVFSFCSHSSMNLRHLTRQNQV